MLRINFKITDQEALHEAIQKVQQRTGIKVWIEDDLSADDGTKYLCVNDAGEHNVYALMKVAHAYGVIRTVNESVKHFENAEAEVKAFLAGKELT